MDGVFWPLDLKSIDPRNPKARMESKPFFMGRILLGTVTSAANSSRKLASKQWSVCVTRNISSSCWEREHPGTMRNGNSSKQNSQKKKTQNFKNQKFEMRKFRRCPRSPLSSVVQVSQDTPRRPRLVLSTARDQPVSIENRNPDFSFSRKSEKKVRKIYQSLDF